MSDNQAVDKTAYLERLVDCEGFRNLKKSETLCVLYLWRRGCIGDRGMPAHDRHLLAQALDVEVKYTYEILAGLLKAGAIRELRFASGYAYALDPCWEPAWE